MKYNSYHGEVYLIRKSGLHQTVISIKSLKKQQLLITDKNYTILNSTECKKSG